MPDDPFAALLEVQTNDLQLAQLHHRRGHLPEQAELTAVDASVAALEGELTEPRQDIARLDARQAALEAEIASTSEKITSAERRLYGGSVTSSRELQAGEADLTALKKRRGELEDSELEVLIEREPIDAVLVAGDRRRAALDAEGARLRAVIAEAQVVIDGDAQRAGDARAAAMAVVPPDLARVYDEVRGRNNGVAIARLEHGTCMACLLKLSAVDLDRIRRQPVDTLVRCEQCGAILVR